MLTVLGFYKRKEGMSREEFSHHWRYVHGPLIMALSRYREFAADRGSALITGAPENLMSALQKIASGITQIPQRDLREVAGMNAFFIVPTNWRAQVGELFMDHPPLEKRLAALAEISRELELKAKLEPELPIEPDLSKWLALFDAPI